MKQQPVHWIATAAATLLAGAALAQAYPSKQILVVSSASPGTSGDAALRLMAAKMTENMGQTVLVEQRTAARGAQAHAVMAKAVPDGHTITYGTSGTFVYARFLFKNIAFDVLKDYTPISASLKSPSYIGLPKSMGLTTLQAMIDYAKKNPGKIEYGSTGSGSYFHLATEALKHAAGIDLLHIPYAQVNFPQLQNDWASGRIPLYLGTWNSYRLHVDKFNVLAIVDRQRSKYQPNVATVAELLPNYELFTVWWGFLGPVGLPTPIAQRVATESRRAMLLPDVMPKLEDVGMTVMGSTPEEHAAMLRADIEAVGKVVKAIGLKPE